MDSRRSHILFCVACVASLELVQTVTIRTPQGLVDGKIESLSGYGDITKFLGLPYALPPVGKLRFMPSELAANFTGVYNAKYSRPFCLQPERSWSLLNLTDDTDIRWLMSEDCLYLNIYVPGTVRPGRDLPVMVWIHGGAWLYGAGSHYDARRLAAVGGVIVVTLNYRLGILGFFPNGLRESTLGLSDQIEALRWVKMNIWSYGGDPALVTLFGESAGGASVLLLSCSKQARGLFRRTISQSASLLWSGDNNVRRSEKLAAIEMVVRPFCSADLLQCLKSASPSQLVDIPQFVLSSLRLVTWSPEVDHHIIDPNFSNDSSLIHSDLEFIVGFNSNAGISMVDDICTHDFGESCRPHEGLSYQSVRQWMSPNIELPTFERIGKHYLELYGGSRQMDKLSLLAASSLVTDWFHRLPTERLAAHLRKARYKIYVYEFNAKALERFSVHAPVSWSNDAQQCDELPFVFCLPKQKDDKMLAMSVVNLWTSFAKGRPSKSWLQYSNAGDYLYIGPTSPVTADSLITAGRYESRRPLLPDVKKTIWRSWFTQNEFPTISLSTTSGSGEGQAERLFLALATISFYVVIYSK